LFISCPSFFLKKKEFGIRITLLGKIEGYPIHDPLLGLNLAQCVKRRGGKNPQLPNILDFVT